MTRMITQDVIDADNAVRLADLKADYDHLGRNLHAGGSTSAPLKRKYRLTELPSLRGALAPAEPALPAFPEPVNRATSSTRSRTARLSSN